MSSTGPATGVTSAWLSARGAHVVGVDLSAESVARSREVVDALGLRATFVTSLEEAESGPFDAVVGRYALHHTDVPEMARLLASRVRPGSRGAFVETFATNPVLRFARGSFVGRLGVRKLTSSGCSTGTAPAELLPGGDRPQNCAGSR